MKTKKLPCVVKLLSGFHKNGKKKFFTVKFSQIEGNELRVFRLLEKHGNLRIGDIAKKLDDMGSHKRHESPRVKTTPRQVYQIIRNLRDMRVPIVGDKSGVHIAERVDEVKDFADFIIDKANADYASMMRLKTAMLQSVLAVKQDSFFY